MMRLGSAKDVKTWFSNFAAALAFRCILLIMMRLGSAKDVKTLFSHFVVALAFRCIFINT